MLTPRGYQSEAVQAPFDYFAQNGGNPLIVMPTASGKSLVQALFIKRVLEAWAEQRILVLTHVKELIEQNHEKLLTVWPEAPAGIHSASLGERDTSSNVIYGGIQSIHKKAFELGRINLILIDEAHLVPAKDAGMYRSFINDLLVTNPDLKIIGLTATHYRMDCGLLTDGGIFTDVAYEVSIRRLLDEGYLSPVTTKATTAHIDTKGVRTRAGDFVKGDLEKAVHADGLTEAMLSEVMAKGAARRSWLFFCVSVDHAQEIADRLCELGVVAACLHGGTPKDEREQIIAAYRSGHIQAVTNCDILTTGFDAPATDLLVLLRPTKSVSLYVQIIGRGMRLSPDTGKTDCLVLDFAGNIERHGPVDSIEVKAKRKKGEQAATGAPTKVCPDCESIVSVFATECESCGYLFPRKDPHERTASELGILTDDIAPQRFEVDAVNYARHRKLGKPDSLRVTYRCGLSFFDEWVCIEHEGFARRKAQGWWAKRMQGQTPVTVTDALALSDELRKPSAITVSKSGKFTEIKSYEFECGGNQRPDRPAADTAQPVTGAALHPLRALQRGAL